jgi:hypothetical protein
MDNEHGRFLLLSQSMAAHHGILAWRLSVCQTCVKNGRLQAETTDSFDRVRYSRLSVWHRLGSWVNCTANGMARAGMAIRRIRHKRTNCRRMA